jgi:hypothetical protein
LRRLERKDGERRIIYKILPARASTQKEDRAEDEATIFLSLMPEEGRTNPLACFLYAC